MFSVAIKMLRHDTGRSISTAAGVIMAFFLIAAQFGLLVGWCNTTSAVVRYANVDVWVMAKQTPTFDYGTNIPKRRIHQTRTVPGVAWAEGMFITWTFWQRPDGGQVSIELVGLDNDCVGGPWQMSSGTVQSVQTPDRVIIDELFLRTLGVAGVGDEVEIFNRRAVVGGISKNIRTFTAAPWVFSSLESAIKYDARTDGSEISYVLVRCEPGFTPEAVRDAIAVHVPGIEALTTHEFVVRTVRYWILETGAGITVLVTAVLGLIIGTVIISQTLYAITNDHLSDYATLLAIGFSRWQLIEVVIWQSLMFGGIGVFGGSILFYYGSQASAKTQVPLETTPLIYSGIIVTTLLCCVFASLISIRSILRIDPVRVFRA